MRFLSPLLLISLCFLACHQPQKLVQPGTASTSTDTSSTLGGAGKIYGVNTAKQICNPGISLDTVNYPGAMLWLNFSGDLVANNPPTAFTTSNAIQHDRLTITRGKDNTVQWFLYKDSVAGVQCEFQDPDWSSSAAWIVTSGARAEHGNCDNDVYIYSGWVIRPHDNARFKFNNDHIDEISTPAAWFGASVTGPDSSIKIDSAAYTAEGLATSAAIHNFFGSNQVKFAWSKQENGYTIHYIDYSEATPTDRVLAKPAGFETAKAESGMISPDGNWIAYNLYVLQDDYRAYIQALAPGSTPILLDSGATDPRWFVHPSDPSRLFLVYATQPAGIGYVLKDNYLDSAVVKANTIGATYEQEVRLYAGQPADIAVELVGAPRKIANLPFRGGRSPDGRWLATGTNYGFMMELN